MRIVHLLTYLDSQSGGMERQALQLAKRLRAKGHEIFFITCAHRDRMRRDRLRLVDTLEGFPVYRIPLVRCARRWNAALYGACAWFLLLYLHRRYDVMHAHQLYTSGIVAGAAKFFLCGKRLIVKNCCGGTFGDVRFLAELPFGRMLVAFLRRTADVFIAISEETAREMEVVSFAPIVRIPNGVDTAFFSPPSDAEKAAARHALFRGMSAKYIVLFVGKLDPQKNVSMLIEAMRMTADDVLLLIVGDGPLCLSLEQQAASLGLHGRVRFFGIVRNVLPFYRAADVFVLPSRAEGASNVLLEAMSMRLPCIGSDIAGIRAMIDDGVSGYLAPIDDAGALGRTIARVCADADGARVVAENARQSVVARFSFDHVAAAYAAEYNRLRV